MWASIDSLLAGLDDDDWSRPTNLPGWDVKAVVAHIIGTESMLLGEKAPDVAVDEATHPHVRNDIGRFNEAWVAAMAGDAPADVLEHYRDHGSRRVARRSTRRPTRRGTPSASRRRGRTPTAGSCASGCSTAGCTSRTSATPSGGPAGRTAPAATVALDEIEAVLGYVVGKKAGAPQGSRVRFELTGPAARTIDVEVGERAAVVDELSGPPTVTLTMPAGVFARLGGGRVDPATVRDQITVDGDAALGEQIVSNMAFTI